MSLTIRWEAGFDDCNALSIWVGPLPSRCMEFTRLCSSSDIAEIRCCGRAESVSTGSWLWSLLTTLTVQDISSCLTAETRNLQPVFIVPVFFRRFLAGTSLFFERLSYVPLLVQTQAALT